MGIDARGQKEVEVKSTQQLWGSLVPNLLLASVYVSAFLYFRRGFRDVYDPKRRRLRVLEQGRDHPTVRGLPEAWKDRPPGLTAAPLPPPDVPANPVTWFVNLWRFSDASIIAYVGSDAYMFLRFLRVGYWLSLAATVVGVLIILPINVHGGNGLPQLERLSMANVADKSRLLWVHWVAAYLLSLLALWLLLEEYKKYADLRQRYLRSPVVQNYSIIVRDIPREIDCRTLTPYLEQVLGQEITAIHPVNDHRRLRYERTKRRKDEATIRLTRALEEATATGTRPTHRGPLTIKGLPLPGVPLGPPVDTIDAMEDTIEDCNRRLQMLKAEAETTETLEGDVQAAVITVDFIRVASAYKKLPFQDDIRFFHVKEAPAPRHLLWRNLTAPFWSRRLRSILVWLAVLALILGYTVPVAFVSSLANLEALARTSSFRWLRPVVQWNPAVTSFIQGFLPPLVISIFLGLLPAILKALSRQQMLPSSVDCENSAIYKLFLFYVLDIFLAYTVAGSFLSKIQQLSQLLGKPTEVVPLFATTLPAQSVFFINYIMLGAFGSLPMEMLRLGALVMVKLRKWVLQKKRGLWDELALLTEEMGFHYLYGFPLVVFLALTTYAIMAPLITPFALGYFALAYPVYLHQLVYVYQPSAHTGGSQFPIIFACCATALVFMQILLIGVMGLKKAATPSALLVPLLAMTVAFAIAMRRAFNRVAEVATLESLAHTDLQEYGPGTEAALAKAYSPLPDDGQAAELSMATLEELTDPYGVVGYGKLTEGQRAAVEMMNAAGGAEVKPLEEGLVVREEEKQARLLPLMGEMATGPYGSTAMVGGGNATGGGGGSSSAGAHGRGEAKWEDIKV